MNALIRTKEYERRAEAIGNYYAQFITGDPNADYPALSQADDDLRELAQEFTVEL